MAKSIIDMTPEELESFMADERNLGMEIEMDNEAFKAIEHELDLAMQMAREQFNLENQPELEPEIDVDNDVEMEDFFDEE